MSKRGWISVDSVTAMIVIIVFSAYGLYGSTMESTLGVDYVGPDFFPKAVGIIAVGLGVLMLIMDRIKRRSSDDGEGGDGAVSHGLTAAIVVPPLLMLLYVLSFNWLGFPIATALFLCASARYLGCPSWLISVLFALAGTLAAVLLFRMGLGLRFPQGVIVRFW